MTPAARYAAAIGILGAWRAGQPAEQALTHWARGARYAGSKDRAAVRDHVYDVLRRTGSCAAAGGGTDGRALVLGLLRLQQDDPDAVFTGAGHAPAALTEAERAAPVTDPDPRLDLPEWTHPLLRACAPDAFEALLEAFAHRAPLWLRVNLRRGGRDGAMAALAAEGIATRVHPQVDTALEVIAGARKLRHAAAYDSGLVEPQDLSVQWAIARVDWPATGRILDYCAGGGGKALAIADRSAAQVFAHDANPRRMADLEPRAARAGVDIATLSTAALPGDPFDLVLTDVPCSGSGTWRRDPDAKWRLTSGDLDDLVAVQAGILDQAAGLVRPGGRLVYMTCSLFAVENEAQVEAFLARQPHWQLEAQSLDTPLTASDGFFSAVLRCP